MRKSFTWFLSLMVLLIAFAIPGYAQEQQETVELYAEEASDCYNEADDYTVKISVRDFIKLNRFELDLEFNDEIFDFVGVSNVHASLTTLTASEAAGVISLDWAGTAATIGDNVTGGTQILVLHFSVIGYPGNVANSYSTDMEWVSTSFWYDIPVGDDLVNTDRSIDGSLTVNVGLTGIETEMTSETCFGGEATIKVTAPPASLYLFNEDPNPANWIWTNSNEYQAAAGETVTIRVKNTDGCMSLKRNVVIPETIEPVAFTVTTQNPACYGAQGSVVINATGGTAPYEYWIATLADGSNAVKKGNFQFSMAPGTYYVNVQDANDCASLPWEEITIVDNNAILEVGATVVDVLCYGETTGEIAATVVQGDLTMVSLDGLVWDSLPYTFEDLAAGTYDVHAKNENGCIVILEDVVVAQPSAPITFDIVIDDTSCGGDSNGVITVIDVMGGTAPYEYSLDEGVTWVSDSILTGLAPTYYSLWVMDDNGCTVEYDNPNATGNVIAVQSPDDIQYDVVITDPPCNEEAASVEIANVTGGTGSYIYSFDGGATWVDTMTIDSWVYPYAPATIWVANADSTCAVQQMIDSDDVDNPELLMVSVEEVFAPTCIEGTDGNIHLLITGGSKPYSYSINGSSWKTSNDELTIIKASVGTHTILVKDANGCEYDTEIEVVIDMDENVIWAESDDNIDCYGDKAGTISLYFTSWADGLDVDAPYRGIQFYVQNEAGQVSSFMPSNMGGTTTTFNAGTYIVWVVDQYTCESNTDTVLVTQNPELLITDVVANGASCFGTFEGTITVHATGGNVAGLLEYAVVNNEGALGNIEEDKWLPFETYDPITKLSTVSFYVDGGTYWISVRDNGCDLVTYGPIEVDGYEELLVDEDDIDWSDPLCFEDENGTITVPMGAVSGGAGAYLFTLLEWVGGTWVAMEDYTDQATGVFTGLPEGVYAVLVEDAEDCPSYTTEEPIVLEDPEELTFDTDFWHMRCENTNDGVITINVDGGTPDYWYAINNMNTWVAFGEDETSKTYIATEPGTFIIWVKDANGCITTPDTITILEPTALSATVTVTNALCNGASTGSISVVGTGGWTGMTQYEFRVNLTGTWTSATTITGLPAGDHTLYVRDVNSYSMPYQDLDCTYSVPFTITQPGKITYEVVIEKVSCKDGSDGTLTVNVLSGGTPWNLEGTVNDGYNIRITGTDVSTDWMRTGADNSHTFAGLAHSHYTVYIVDANGCQLDPTVGDYTGSSTTVESWEVNEPDTYLTVDPEWLKDATCFGAKDGQIKLVADGGTAPYKYYAGLSVEPDGHILTPAPPAENSPLWQVNDTLNVGAGTWVVWVLDFNGCMIGGEYENGVPVNKWRVKVEQPAQVVWDFHKMGTPPVVHYVMPKCYGDWNGEVHLVNISGGSGVYNASVTGISADGDTVDLAYTNIAQYLAGGLYKLPGVPASSVDSFMVTVTDSIGCESVVRKIMVKQPVALTVTLQESPDNYSCFGAVEGWIEATAMGGNGSYEYQLLKNDVVHTPWQSIASAFLVQVGNKFTVQVRDAKGCVAEDTLWMPTPLKVEYTYEDLTCADDAKAKVKINVSGTPGREFRVWYREVEQDVPTSTVLVAYNGWFSESIIVEGVFIFDNELFVDHHYEVVVEDDHGCFSVVDTLTFDRVQTAVTLNVVTVATTECTQEVEISFSGGVSPYVVMLNDSVVTEMTHTLARGINVIKVMDAHMCVAEQTLDVVGMYVTRDTTINTYIDEETIYADVESGVTDTLAVGTYEYVYMYGDCERTLNVTVVEVPRPYTIAEVQGDSIATPIKGKIAQITGTVTGISAGEGFFVQDAVAAWSGIWVEYSGVDTLGIEVGDGVVVVGVVDEIADVTTIMATEVMEAEGTIAITPIKVTPTEAEAEKYESVLVKVFGARATSADAGSGEWTIYYQTTDNVIVNDWLYAYTPVDSNYYDVTGIVNGRLDAFKLEPRMASDIVDITATTPVNPNYGIAFKVYPNPFSDKITIDNNEKLTRVVISNIAGQRVIDIEYPNREIRTANLVSGIYVISLYTENGIAKTERMIKR